MSNIVKSLTDILDEKAPKSDGLTSLLKDNGRESSLNFALGTNVASLQLLNDNIFKEKINSSKVEKPRKMLQALSTHHPQHPINKKNRAAFMKNKLWKNGSTINIYFMEEATSVPRTSSQK